MRVVVIFRFWNILRKPLTSRAGLDSGHCKLYHPYCPTTSVNTVWPVSTSQAALRVIILHTWIVSISEEGVVEERPANAATSGSHIGW